MSLLREIQNDAASSEIDVASLLRKCKILAGRLGSREFSAWVDMELNGYPVAQPVPKYRKLVTSWWAQFVSPAWNVDRAAIPEFIVPKESRKHFHWTEISEGVAAVQDFASADAKAVIARPELTPAVQGKMYPGMSCTNVWSEIHSSAFAQLLSAIRTRVLDFAMDIEAENPAAGEAPLNSKPIPEEKLTPIVINHIGQVGNLAQSSHSFQQTAHTGIQPGDLEALKKFLLSEKVSPQGVKELEDAVRSDKGQFGPRVQAWLGKMAVTSAEIGKAVAIQAIIAAVKAHFGMH